MATPEPTTAQPKISQKMVLRTALLLFALAILFFAYRYVEGRHGDFDFGDPHTPGMIAAIEQKPEGQEAVIFRPDGTKLGTDGWKAGVHDRDPVWNPDGKFLYFVSDRGGKAFDLYRWNPDRSDAAQMTSGTRGRSNPTFPADNPTEVNSDLLMISSGMVLGFDPVRKVTPQLLPPPTPNITQSSSEDLQGGADAEFAALYGSLGTAFRYARWCKNDQFIAAIMEREGGGEVLIIQSIQLKDGRLPPPTAICAGDHVEFDVNPHDGSVVYVVQGFKFPDPQNVPAEFKKNNKVTRPFAHAIGFIDPETRSGGLIGASLDDKHSFGGPAVSPDGSTLLVTEGTYDSSSQNQLSAKLLTMPL